MLNPTAADAPSRPLSALLTRVEERDEARSKFPLSVAASVLAHGVLVFVLSGVSAADESRRVVEHAAWIDLTPAETAVEPPAPVEKPPEPTPRALPVRKARSLAQETPRETAPAEPPAAPPAEPEPAAAASAEPAIAAPTLLTADAPSSAGSVAASSSGGGGTGASSTPSVRGTGTAQPAPSGPSDADRKLAQSRYVHSLEDLIRAHTHYPRAAARAGLEGRVVLGLRIARDGSMLGLRVASSSGHDLLDDAALEAAREIGHLPTPPALAVLDSKDEVRVGVVYVIR